MCYDTRCFRSSRAYSGVLYTAKKLGLWYGLAALNVIAMALGRMIADMDLLMDRKDLTPRYLP